MGPDCVISRCYKKQPHPHPNLPLEGEGTKSSKLALMPLEGEGALFCWRRIRTNQVTECSVKLTATRCETGTW